MIAPAINEHAVVLHRRPFRESSMMLDLLTSNYGRVKCILHGRGKNRGNITSFVEYGTSWRGRTDLVTVTNCEPLRSFDFAGKTLFSGFYLNELILARRSAWNDRGRFVRSVPHCIASAPIQR